MIKYSVPKIVFLAMFSLLSMPQVLAQHILNFRVHNQTRTPVVKLYVSDSRINDWEEDVLGDGILNPGETGKINFSGPSDWCLFDIKAVFSDGDEAEKYEVNLCKVGDFYINP
jgi:hypothetical protein